MAGFGRFVYSIPGEAEQDDGTMTSTRPAPVICVPAGALVTVLAVPEPTVTVVVVKLTADLQGDKTTCVQPLGIVPTRWRAPLHIAARN